jgi:3-methyladenine DNA glycosylase AlkD
VKVITATQLERMAELIEAIGRLTSVLSANAAPEIKLDIIHSVLPQLVDEFKSFHRSVAIENRWQTIDTACRNQQIQN